MTRGDDGEWKRTASVPTRRGFLVSAGVLGTGVLAGCVGNGDGSGGPGTESTEADGMGSGSMDGDANGTADGSMGDGMGGGDGSMGDGMNGTDEGMGASGNGSEASWRSMELTPVRGGDPFTVDGFDRPVVLETFAVWCPSCEKQQRKLRDLDDSVVVISLNTDPNEDAAKVRAHAEKKGFDWRFAVAPPEMTKALIDEFGPTVTNAPSTPVVVACQNGSAEFLSGRIHSAATIEDAAGKCK
jgi:thiol-disulfide isomerase/thioredoxin